MQFITDGPDVPSELLHAHEEGKVIFFCGAGISYPAGLPGFKRLVKEIYGLNHTRREAGEKISFKQDQFDKTLDLLEQRLPGGRPKVLEALWQVLQPKEENLKEEEALNSHKALLQLGRNRDGRLRLVTTNFDRLFHLASQNDKTLEFASYGAPLLPIPKKNHWDGLVFLHGLLPENCDEVGLNNLVVTSGDFGLAYLLECWAARFVSELFHNYTVCFVGYSLNDPILRYITDALAADRRRGNHNHQAWAFAMKSSDEWNAKDIKPIFYKNDDDGKHKLLHKTLEIWAKNYRDGIEGKKSIVRENSSANPLVKTVEDDFVSRMLWALSDPSGEPAKYFAELNPVPSLEWLKVFEEKRFGLEDLPRFGVAIKEEAWEKDFKFSLLNRPTPSSLAPSMQLISVSDEEDASRWDKPMLNLADWLLRHLNDPELFFHFTKKGGRLHPMMARKIRERLKELGRLQKDEKEKIQRQEPNAIPSPDMQERWLQLLGEFKDFLPEQKEPVDLTGEEKWSEERWRQALDSWRGEILGKRNEEANKQLINRFWSKFAPLLIMMPKETFYNLAQPLSLWLQVIATLVEKKDESSFIKLCKNIIALPPERWKDFSNKPADFHPIGAITTALIHFYLREPRHDGDGLLGETNKLLTKICNDHREEYGAGHTILGINLITLFRLDKTWTEQNILPRLDWQKSKGARDFWIGFLRSPRLYPPLFKAFKSHFLEMTKLEYYEPFEDVYKKQIAAGLTSVALTHMEGYSNEELQQAIANLPLIGLESVARTLLEMLRSSDQREAYWRNRIAPFWKEIWPKNKRLMSPTIREYLALLAIEAGNEFPQALELMEDWLLCQGGKNTGNAFDTIIRVIQTLESSRYKFLIDSYPKEVLKFLDILIPRDFPAEWLGSTQETLEEFLEKIKQANPSLTEDERFRRLEFYT